MIQVSRKAAAQDGTQQAECQQRQLNDDQLDLFTGQITSTTEAFSRVCLPESNLARNAAWRLLHIMHAIVSNCQRPKLWPAFVETAE